MIAFLRRFFSNPAWDSKGRFTYLLDRESDQNLCVVSGVPLEVVDEALKLFCDAFDIPDEQRYCLRPSDQMMDIYKAMVTGFSDDLEFERLTMNLDKAIGRKITDEESVTIKSLEDLVRFLCVNKKSSG